MAIGTPNFTRSAIDSPTADFAKVLSSFGTNMVAQARQDEELKLQRDRQAAQDARQVIADKQNKQLFDLKMEDANRTKQDLIDKDAYLKGMVNPSAYGLKAGTEDVVNWLGSYTGDDARTQSALKAGPGTPEYEAHFKRMENVGNYITGKSLDDRTIGFSTANPNNRYAAEEMMKATISRQNALDKEAKDVADNQLKYQLESLKQSGKTGGVSGDGTSTGKVGMTAGGYKVSSPDEVAETATKLLKSTYGLKPEDPLHQKVAGLVAGMANMNYSASQITEAANKVFTPGKSIDYWPDKAPEFKDIAVNVGTPKNVAVQPTTNTAYTDTLSGLSQSYADRLAKIQEQRDGTYGMDKVRELISGPAQSTLAGTNINPNEGKVNSKYTNTYNFTNVKKSNDKWEGAVEDGTSGEFVKVQSPELGARMAIKDLRTKVGNGYDTIEKVLNRHAPEKDKNPTAIYIKNVSDWTGIAPGQKLTEADLTKVVKAMARQEHGKEVYDVLTDDVLAKGYELSGGQKTTVKDLFAKVEESSNSKGKDAQGVLDYYSKKREEIANVKTNAWDRTVNAVKGGPTVDDGYGKLTGKSYSKDISNVSDALRKDGFSSAEDIAILASNMPEGKDKEAVANVLHYKQMQSDPEYRQLMKEQQINDAAWLAADTILAAVPIGKLVGSVAKRVGGLRTHTTALPNGLAGTTGREAMKIGVAKAATEKAAAKAAIEKRIAGLEHDLQQLGGELSKNKVGSGMTRAGLEKDFAAIRKAQKELQDRLKGL